MPKLDEENRKPKQLVADPSLDQAMLQDVLQEGSEAGPAQGVGQPSATSYDVTGVALENRAILEFQ